MKKSVATCVMVAGLFVALLGGFPMRASASTTNTNTDVVPVEIDDGVTIAEAGKYEIDTDFLKDYNYGETHRQEALYTFSTVESLKSSTLANLKNGVVVYTKGYYQPGDTGRACYKIGTSCKAGGIELANGLYANLMADEYTDAEGHLWAVVNVMQLGAHGDGSAADNQAINDCITLAGNFSGEDTFYRAMAYLPAGEYKCDDKIYCGQHSINVCGEGESTILFTDNDYRKDSGYSEFFFEVWGASDVYFGDFTLEGREVDLYHYMRQFVLVYSQNIYVKSVDMLIPQETYHSYYFQDKQYSNFCCYCGNSDITVDDCKMVQMSGTYRGANVGVLDIWSKGEDNITIMNCDLYGNARDEQIGFFSTSNSGAHVKNVDFINNTIHAYEPKYTSVVGNATMRFTIGYSDSLGVDDIHIAGNHFIVECDSKFMTFGAVTNCIIEKNIMEIKCTYKTWSSVFDSANKEDDNILIRNNDFYLTSDENFGKGNFIGGNLTFTENRVVTDVPLAFGFFGRIVKNNEFVFLGNVKKFMAITDECEVSGNTVYSYGKLGSLCSFSASDDTADLAFTDNTIYDYQRNTSTPGPWDAISSIEATANSITFSDNKYFAPNTILGKKKDKTYENNEELKGYDNWARLFYYRCSNVKTINCENNILQGTRGYAIYDSSKDTVFNNNNNDYRDWDEKEDDVVANRVEVSSGGKVVTDISTTADTVDLDALVYLPKEVDEEGKVLSETAAPDRQVVWYSTVDSMADVSQDGVVTRKIYGDVTIYAVSPDGCKNYGKCVVHFEKAAATDIVLKSDTVVLQPELKEYLEYQVIPKEASQEVKWESADPAVATVLPKGVVTGVAVGETDLTCSTPDGKIKKTVHVKVEEVTVKRIDMNDAYKYIPYNEVGTTYQAGVSYYPTNAANQTVGKWESSNEEIATVDDNGLVTILKNGIVRIRAYSSDLSCYGTTILYIQPPTVSTLSVSKVADTKATLEWNEVEGVQGYGYNVYYRVSGDEDWIQYKAGKDNYTENTYVNVTGLTADTTYEFLVRPFIVRWQSGKRVWYEAEDSSTGTNLVTFTTTSYIPVTSISGNKKYLYSYENAETEIVTVTYSEKANYPGLEIQCSIEDPTVAEISQIVTSETDSTLGANQIKVKLKGLKGGLTKLIVKSNDDYGAQLSMSVGVVPRNTLDKNSIVQNVSFRRVDISFNGMEDESRLGGYFIGKRVSQHYEMIAYIPVDGSDTYHFTQTTNLSDGETERLCIFPAWYDGENYMYQSYNGTPVDVTFPELSTVENISLEQEGYQVHKGNSLDIAALLSREDGEKVSISSLDWNISNDRIADVKRSESSTSGDLQYDYAKLTGKSVGETELMVASTDGSLVMAKAKIIVTPEKVTGISVTSGSTSVTLKWNKNPGVTGYHIYRYDEEQKTFVMVSDTQDDSYKEDGLQSEVIYRYQIVPYFTAKDGTLYEGEISNDILAGTMKQGVTEPETTEHCCTEVSMDDETTTSQGKIGTIYTIGNYKYKVISKTAVAVTGCVKKNTTSLSIKATVKADGHTYKVTSIAANAFTKCKKVKKVTIGTNVQSIGSKAFYKLSKLKKITIKSKQLKKVGSKAITGVNKKLVIKVPYSKKKTYQKKYKKLFKKSVGFKSTMKIS